MSNYDIWAAINSPFLRNVSLTALLGLAYAIAYNRAKKPHLVFTFSYSTGYYDANTEAYTWKIDGVIKNTSSDENSIVSIHRIAWKNDKKNSYLADSMGVLVEDRNTNKKIDLPLYILSKQALSLNISTKFKVTGTSDEKILRERIEVPTLRGVFLPKYKYELCFEDVNGNFFAQHGRLINKQEADLWWTLPNTFESLKDWDVIPFLRHSTLILASKIVFFLKRTFWSLGF